MATPTRALSGRASCVTVLCCCGGGGTRRCVLCEPGMMQVGSRRIPLCPGGTAVKQAEIDNRAVVSDASGCGGLPDVGAVLRGCQQRATARDQPQTRGPHWPLRARRVRRHGEPPPTRPWRTPSGSPAPASPASTPPSPVTTGPGPKRSPTGADDDTALVVCTRLQRPSASRVPEPSAGPGCGLRTRARNRTRTRAQTWNAAGLPVYSGASIVTGLPRS